MIQLERNRELYHHGILGMKWGVRRYQNKDGSLTAAGKKRAAKLKSEYSDLTGKQLRRSPTKASSSSTGKKGTDSKDPEKKKSVSEMSDSELRQKLERARLEKEYYETRKRISELNPRTLSTGEKFVKGVMDVAVPAIKESSRDALTKYLKKFMSESLGLNDQDTESASKALERKAKDLENKKKIYQTEKYFKAEKAQEKAKKEREKETKEKVNKEKEKDSTSSKDKVYTGTVEGYGTSSKSNKSGNSKSNKSTVVDAEYWYDPDNPYTSSGRQYIAGLLEPHKKKK